MYEKKKIQDEMNRAVGGTNVTDNCFICDRAKGIVICSKCGHTMKDVRARRKCSIHPREFFLMDIANCSQCKSLELLEEGLDVIPEHLQTKRLVRSPSPVRSLDFSSPPRTASGFCQELPSAPVPMEVVPSSFVQFSPRLPSDPIIRGQKRARGSRVVLPSNANVQWNLASSSPGLVVHTPESVITGAQSFTPPPDGFPDSTNEPCICQRVTEFIICTDCGYYATGVRKYQKCSKHPENKQGVKFCPECGAAGDQLDEQ